VKPIRTLIVDDEAPARERLRRLLTGLEEVQVVGEAGDGIEAVELIEGQRPDLVLLDIQMPGLDGFGVLQALAEPPTIIFVTAYDEYARHAQEALAGGQDLAAQLGPLLESLATEGRFLTRLAVHDQDLIRVLDVEDVDWIGIENEQVMVHAGDQVYPIRRTLTELEAQLDPHHFFRAHRSALVNLDRVQEIIPWFKGSHILRLTTGAEVELSRAQARALRKILNW
jgi:two-component system LytT family response regulator